MRQSFKLQVLLRPLLGDLHHILMPPPHGIIKLEESYEKNQEPDAKKSDNDST